MHQGASVIALLTDFGLSDGYVGVMKGVILNIEPQARIIDITHQIGPQSVVEGAWILATSYRYFPTGTIYTCVVDPGVGSTRLPIAVHAGNWFFVCPDNGLLSYILQEQIVHEAVLLANATYHLSSVSATFQGRDIFAPVAAHIACGTPLSELGARLDVETLQRIDIGQPVQQGQHIQATIVHIDHFGNLISSIPAHMLPNLFDSPGIQLTFPAHQIVIHERRHYFADVSDHAEQSQHPFVYIDSSGYIGVAIQNGNAARELGVCVGEQVTFFTG